MHKVGKVVTREWRKAKSAKLEFPVVSGFQLLEIIQVLDSISWARCASGNVLFLMDGIDISLVKIKRLKELV